MMNSSVSKGRVPNTSTQYTKNVAHSNAGGACTSRAPVAPCQVFRGNQVFGGTVKNTNTYTDSGTGSRQNLQTFDGKQEFKKAVTNTNEVKSTPHSLGANPQVKMQDIGDGIRVSVPLQAFEGDQVFHDTVTNNNTLDSNNKNYNSNNVGSRSGDANNVAAGRKPAAITLSATQPQYHTVFDNDSDESFLQSFKGSQKFMKEVRNNNTTNSNNNNHNSNNVGVDFDISGGTASTTEVDTDEEEDNITTSASTAEIKKRSNWAKRLFKNPLQVFEGRQKFMAPVTNNNSINSNNHNVNSNNQWSN